MSEESSLIWEGTDIADVANLETELKALLTKHKVDFTLKTISVRSAILKTLPKQITTLVLVALQAQFMQEMARVTKEVEKVIPDFMDALFSHTAIYTHMTEMFKHRREELILGLMGLEEDSFNKKKYKFAHNDHRAETAVRNMLTPMIQSAIDDQKEELVKKLNMAISHQLKNDSLPYEVRKQIEGAVQVFIKQHITAELHRSITNPEQLNTIASMLDNPSFTGIRNEDD